MSALPDIVGRRLGDVVGRWLRDVVGDDGVVARGRLGVARPATYRS